MSTDLLILDPKPGEIFNKNIYIYFSIVGICLLTIKILILV